MSVLDPGTWNTTPIRLWTPRASDRGGSWGPTGTGTSPVGGSLEVGSRLSPLGPLSEPLELPGVHGKRIPRFPGPEDSPGSRRGGTDTRDPGRRDGETRSQRRRQFAQTVLATEGSDQCVSQVNCLSSRTDPGPSSSTTSCLGPDHNYHTNDNNNGLVVLWSAALGRGGGTRASGAEGSGDHRPDSKEEGPHGVWEDRQGGTEVEADLEVLVNDPPTPQLPLGEGVLCRALVGPLSVLVTTDD